MSQVILSGEDSQDLPSIRNMLGLRRLKNNEVNESYVYFCENFLKCVVGTKSFNKAWKDGVPVSQIATISDEALALLLIENSEGRWLAEVAKKDKGEEVFEKDLPPSVYTTSASHSQKKRKKGFTQRYGGWSFEGITRFIQLFEQVAQDRELNNVFFNAIVQKRAKVSKENDTAMCEPKKYVKALDELGFGKKNAEVPKEISTGNGFVSV